MNKMKNLIFAMSVLVLVSCKDNKTEQNTPEIIKTESVTVEHHDEHQKEAATNVYDNSWKKEIVINNGAKWQADKMTNAGVLKMQNTIKEQKTGTLDDYHTLAKKLNDDKNEVIRNCTMKGASHDNLHTWLLPLLAKIEALSVAQTVEDAAKIKASIEDNVNSYSEYFQ